MKKINISKILHDPDISGIEKRIAFEKWKFNQLPIWYRKDHAIEIQEKIKDLAPSLLAKIL
jgi:hypothetical protein